jgi:DNA-binding CsgD family transcriptional regulator
MPSIPDPGQAVVTDVDPVNWQHYRQCAACSYPDRTGDLRSVVGISDFYSARQWRNVGTGCGICRPLGFAHDLMLTLPDTAATSAGRTQRLFLFRGPGPDFTDQDRALLTLLRPHLHQILLDAQRARHPTPHLTPRQHALIRLLAAGHTNAQIARRLGITEATVRTHLKTIYQRLNVTNRTAAVTHTMIYPAVFPSTKDR